MIPILSLATSLPWVRVAAGIMLACALFLGGWAARGVPAARDIARLEAQAERVRADHAVALARSEQRARVMQDAVADDIATGVRDARTRAAAAERRAADLDATRERLRVHLVRLAASDAYAADPAAGPASGGAAAAGPGVVWRGWLVELYRVADDEAATLAGYADRAAAAGSLCERVYDAAQARLRAP